MTAVQPSMKSFPKPSELPVPPGARTVTATPVRRTASAR